MWFSVRGRASVARRHGACGWSTAPRFVAGKELGGATFWTGRARALALMESDRGRVLGLVVGSFRAGHEGQAAAHDYDDDAGNGRERLRAGCDGLLADPGFAST
jgi:hypothetical protein